MWVVSRTYVDLISTTPNLRSSGEVWQFSAKVTDDNSTPAFETPVQHWMVAPKAELFR